MDLLPSTVGVCPDPALCAYYGQHVHGRVYELVTCRCPPDRPCSPGDCKPYQDLYALEANILSARGRRLVRKMKMTLLRLGVMHSRPVVFARALVRHAKDWFRLVSRAEYERRVASCLDCGYYSKDYPGGRCAACGCGVQGQVGNKEAGPEPPRWRVVRWLRWRWGRVWGKAWWRSEDCPVCSKCGKKKSGPESCSCSEFVSKWKGAVVSLTVIAKFPGGKAGSAAKPLNVKNGEG